MKSSSMEVEEYILNKDLFINQSEEFIQCTANMD